MVKLILRKDFHAEANIISSLIMQKVEVNNNQWLQVKSGIAPNGNEDRKHDSFKT